MLDLSAKKLPLVGSFFLLFFSIAYVYGERAEMHPHDAQRIGQLVLIGLSAVVIKTHGLKLSCPFFVFVMLSGIAALTAGRWALIECIHLASLYLLALLWSSRLQYRPEPHLLTCCIGLVVVYLAFLLSRWAALVFEGLSFHPQEFFTGFSNQRFFGHWVTLTLPLIVLARLRVKDCSTRALFLDLVAGLWLCFVIASGTRGSWVALGVVALTMRLAGVTGRRIAFGMWRSAFVGVVLYVLMFWVAPNMVSGGGRLYGLARIAEGMQLSGRDVLWSLALDGILERPVFGAGPMMFAALPNGFAAHPHNLFLQIAYEWGAVAAFLIAVVVLRGLYQQFQKCRRENEPLRAALLACIFGGLVQAQVDGVLVMPFGQVLFVFLCAWLASLGAGNTATPTLRSDDSRAFRVVLLLLALVQFWLVSPELRRLEAWEEEVLDTSGTGIYFPRFWAQGVVPVTPQRLMSR